MKRKLVKQGAATLMISLPSKWINENKLDKGDEIDMEISGQTILVSTDLSKKKETTIKLSREVEPLIRSLISNTYRKGYDKILVKFDSQKQFKILKKTVKNNLIGFEIINKNKESCTIENVTEPAINQFENILKKMFLSIDHFFEITRKRLENPNDSNIEDFVEASTRVQRYDNFCRRCLSKQSNLVSSSELFWLYLSMIFHGQRELYLINKIIGPRTKVSNKTKKLLEETYSMFKLAERAYSEKNIELLGEMHDIEQKILREKSHMHFTHGKDSKEHAIVHHIIASARKFFQANSPLAGVLI